MRHSASRRFVLTLARWVVALEHDASHRDWTPEKRNGT